MKVFNKIKNMIKQGVVSLVADDSTVYPQGQAFYNGKTTNYARLSPYGLDSNPPLNSHVLLFSSQAQEAVKFGMASDILNRTKNLLEGEVTLYNTLTGDMFKLDADGQLNLQNAEGSGIYIDVSGNITLLNSADAQIKLKSDGLIAAANSSESLDDLIADLIDAITDIITLGGPTSQSISPASQTALDAIKTRFATLLGGV